MTDRLRSLLPRYSLLLAPVVLLALVFLPSVWPTAHASNDTGHAARAFTEGRYDDAVRHHLEAGTTDGYSASLLFNLGNAYFRTGRLGRAISSYERARVLAPRDPDIAENLAMARREAGVVESGTPVWQRVASWLTLDEWARLGLGALLLLALTFLYRGAQPWLRHRWGVTWEPAAGAYRGLALGLTLVVMTCVTGLAIGSHDIDRAIVVDGAGVLRVSPFAAAQSVGTLPAGSPVTVERAFGDHVRVLGLNGRTGWVLAAQVEPVRAPL